MINVNGKTKEVETDGTMLDVVTDILGIILTLYQAANEDNIDKGQEFKRLIKEQISDELFWEITEHSKMPD